jgi:hypothetical protein
MPILDNHGVPVLYAAGQPTFVDPPTINRATEATIDSHFIRARNYYLSYMNIQRTVYIVLDDKIDNSFKVSNDPALVGWNPAMELRMIFDQNTSTYGRPTTAALLQNDMLLHSIYSPQDAPKVLFHHIKDCQEVQILGKDPNTAQQLLNNAVQLFLQLGLYTRNFDDWDSKLAPEKNWTNLKTFVQECYTRRLNATSITAGLQGYIQNAFAALQDDSDKDNNKVQTVITQMAVLTPQSQLTATTTAKTQALIVAMINQLAAN